MKAQLLANKPVNFVSLTDNFMILQMFKTFKTLFLNIPQQLSWLPSFTHYRDFRETGPGFKKQAAEIRPKSQPGLVRHFPHTVKNDIAICNQLYRAL